MLWSCEFNVQTTNVLSLQKPFEQLPRMSVLIIKHADSFIMTHIETRIYIYHCQNQISFRIPIEKTQRETGDVKLKTKENFID